jgi:hypothetical protein
MKIGGYEKRAAMLPFFVTKVNQGSNLQSSMLTFTID